MRFAGRRAARAPAFFAGSGFFAGIERSPCANPVAFGAVRP
jgi:hypothetical protein